MKLLLLLAVAATCYASSSEYDLPFLPRVMFWCGKVNQHVDLSTGEWTTDADGTSGCIAVDDKAAILDYCRKVYPTKRITNVVETNDGTSAAWCTRGNDDCEYVGRKPAFRCVVGHFEPRALNVPDSCRFNHYYDRDVCLENDRLHAIAVERCGGAMTTTPGRLFDYGMIIECGIDRFRGVEYVCCPPIETETETMETEAPAGVEATEMTEVEEPEATEREKTETVETETMTEVEEPEATEREKTETTRVEIDAEPLPTMTELPVLVHDDVNVDTLAHTLDFQHHCDRKMLHGLYAQQRGRMDDGARGRMDLILKQFRRALAAAGELRQRDSKAAEAMLTRVKTEYRKMVVDSERMAAVDHRKLKGMHLDDLDACYKERMCSGLQMFMMVLAGRPTDARVILDGVNSVLEQELEDHRTAVLAPQKLDRQSQKERHHTLERINKQITYARDFLAVATEALEKGSATFPYADYECALSEKEPEPEEPEMMEESGDLEESGELEEESTPPPPPPPVFLLPMEPGPVILPADPVATETVPEKTEEATTSSPPPVFFFPMEPGPVILPADPVATAEPVATETVPEKIVDEVEIGHTAIATDTDKAVDSGTEWKLDPSQVKPEGLAKSKVNSDSLRLSEPHTSSSSVSYLGMAIGLAIGAAVVIGSLVVVIALRRRGKGGSYEVGIVGEEESARREEDALQESGYENPAYKFFEEMDDEDDEGM